MIIPIKCFTCGKVIADKYRFYLEEIRKHEHLTDPDRDQNKTIYLTRTTTDKTISGQIMDQLGLTKMCCRRHMITHIDID